MGGAARPSGGRHVNRGADYNSQHAPRPGRAPLPPPLLCKYCRLRRQSVAGGGRLSAVTWREASFLCAALFPSSAAILFSPRVGLRRGRRIQVRTPRARRPRTAARGRVGRLCGAGLRLAPVSRALFEVQKTAVRPCPGLGAAASCVRGAAPSRCRSDVRPLSSPPAAPCRSPPALCRSGAARLPSSFRLCGLSGLISCGRGVFQLIPSLRVFWPLKVSLGPRQSPDELVSLWVGAMAAGGPSR